jgi:hypothetical protein
MNLYISPQAFLVTIPDLSSLSSTAAFFGVLQTFPKHMEEKFGIA